MNGFSRMFVGRAAELFALGIFASLPTVFGQTAPPESMPPGARATPLPLSGRTAQPGSVTVMQTTNPGGESVNTLNSTVQPQGAYQGSVPTSRTAGAALAISLDDAVARGIKTNLGSVGFQQSLRQAQGQTTVARSYLLPQVNAALTGVDQQTDLAALGFGTLHLSVPGFSFPTVIGPYHYFDLRAGVSQSIFDRTQLNNYRAAQENAKSTEFSAQDAHDLVALAVTGTYLQVIASASRVDSARAQSATAQETYKEAVDRHNAGVAARIDVTRSQVEFQTEQQRVISLENDLAKQKIAFARLIGLPPGQQYTLTDSLPFAPLDGLPLEDALARAYANRADLKAAESQVHAAEISKHAAEAERLPTISAGADYGVIGTDPTNSHGTFSVTGSVRLPIFNGRRAHGDIEQADAALQQRRAEYEELRGRIDAEVRTAFLDLNSAAQQVAVADSNRKLAADTLQQARDRFAAGVADTIEVVQAQESVAGAERDYIASLFSHNLAKATLARALGQADQNIKQFLRKQ
ncbi:MAG: TolC family protein [Bryobacteraceae bacterium]